MLEIDPRAIPVVKAHIMETSRLSEMLPTAIAQAIQVWEKTTKPFERAEIAFELAKMFRTEAAIQMMLHAPGYYEIRELSSALNSMSEDPEMQAEIQELQEAHKQLFRTSSGKQLATIWFNAAVQEGEESLLLSQASQHWTEATQRLSNEPKRSTTYFSTSDIIHNPQLPTRTDVKQGDKKGKGWTGISYDPETGYQAVYNSIVSETAGTQISKSKKYPSIQDISEP